ncbi:MAG: hypothetical protein LBG64_03425 [Pseudomonadales bacterium]|jgi:hypothetical protein|nr:hypothetical protein [Pseudomonadales bacterium]
MNMNQSCTDVMGEYLCTSVVPSSLIRGNAYLSLIVLIPMDPTRIRFIIVAMVRVMIRGSDYSVVMFGSRRVGCVVRCRRGVQSPT